MENFHPAQARSRLKKARSRLGGLARLSYEHNLFLRGFLNKGEISPNRASPVNRASPPPYEQALRLFAEKNKAFSIKPLLSIDLILLIRLINFVFPQTGHY